MVIYQFDSKQLLVINWLIKHLLAPNTSLGPQQHAGNSLHNYPILGTHWQDLGKTQKE